MNSGITIVQGKEPEMSIDDKIKRIIGIIRKTYPKIDNWSKVKDYITNGQLALDRLGELRFRGDLFTKERFDRAQ